jgi:hypothetical protein
MSKVIEKSRTATRVPMNKVIGTSWAWTSALVLLALAAGMPGTAAAWAGEGHLDEPVGSATQQALDLQRSGARAAPAQPMAGDQASLAYDRYLKSFSQPIPVFFGSSLKSSDSTATSGQ